ncbi:MAG: family 1 glycosylhydrolase [Actinobacteria bacterium]|nr:family 1 glycosylhydrolase [Actinomycetota bacterium]
MEFNRHFSRGDLEELFDDGFKLPDGFMFGVANAAYQVEGGLNGPGEPLNNWADYERSGKVEPSGEAIRFWTDYPEEVELAAGMNLNAFRLSIEWARVQPRSSATAGGVPSFDRGAIEAYSDMIAAVMGAGMEPVVTLQHFTHPYWLGLDFWLEREKLEHFERYVEEIATCLNGFLVEKHQMRPVKYWVTLNEPNALAPATYLIRYFPHRKGGVRKSSLAWGNMIDAHCRAYDTLHHVYQEKRWPRPSVSYNTTHLSVYLLDKVMTDLLNARRNGVEQKDLPSYLERGREAWDEEIARCPEVRKAPRRHLLLERLLVKATDRFFRLEDLQHGIDAIYSSPNPDKMDYLAVDYYDPFFRNMVKAPTLQDIREKRFNLNAELWEQVLNPRGMYHFLKAEVINGEGLPLLILENGMCYKVYRGRVEQRPDRATRDRFLQSYIYEAMRAVKDGLPLTGYFHWTMVDNYEWGSYEPRFGLFTVDRSRSPVRISPVDSWGINAGKAYGELVSALRSGDRERIVTAFLRDCW